MVFFSVVIPVFNRVNLISATLDSVLNQTFSDYEIVVVDDGSTDGTQEILDKYIDKIKIIHQQNCGPGAARNLGISHAQGKYIAFLDSDDLWFSWTLATFKQTIKKHNFPSFIVGNAIYFHDDLDFLKIQIQPFKSKCFADYYAASNQDLPFLTSAVTIQREVIQQVGGFSNKWINAEDNDLWLKLGTFKGFVYIQSPMILAYRQHETSAITNVTKTFQGTCHLIQQEKQGLYPGGEQRLTERLKILTRHLRPVSIACLNQGKFQEALQLYKDSFFWHLRLYRFRYLMVFPILYISAFFEKSLSIKQISEAKSSRS